MTYNDLSWSGYETTYVYSAKPVIIVWERFLIETQMLDRIFHYLKKKKKEGTNKTKHMTINDDYWGTPASRCVHYFNNS